ncbi:HAMP domain protein (fragment) [Candidatus Desulfosporosinus infrequens]|uniref:histidine kinase n=1 Tax=Candidatus Desulfosporosinus infrequens TaxID=2043169 RepID=A0A2U3L059_9FIRM
MHTPAGGALRILLAEAERPIDDDMLKDETMHRLRDVFWRKGEKIDDVNLREGNSAVDLRSDGWVQVTVVDSGEGIPAEELEHIFDRFYRVNKARERESGGTGLGLAIAREFIQAHGGSIQVESKPGVGSQFRIFLPVKNENLEANTLTIS